MSQIVQAKCPHCQRPLRIPVEWASRPMRCKHCQQVFQARVTTPTPVAGAPPAPSVSVATPLPPSAPPPAPVPPVPAFARSPRRSADPFDFDSDEPAAPLPLRRGQRARGTEWWKYLLVAGCVVAVVALGLVIFWDDLFGSGPDTPGGPIVQNGNGQPGKGGNPKNVIPGAFPRRALLINVNNYLLANPLHYGNPRAGDYPGSSTNVLRDQLQRPPMNVPSSQITELSDSGRNPHSTVRSVIEQTLTDFVKTSREQDRIIVLFAGHAVEIEKEAYLVPLEGDLGDPKTLIPLAWVYDQLGKCPARQKLLILDVCRYPPARGYERPGSGPMGEVLDAKLQNPPAGVQVWSACVKEQQSIELEGGSVFLQALCASMQERGPGIQEPNNPLPLDVLVPRVNQHMKKVLEPQKLEQAARLTGTAPERGASYDPKEGFPDPLALKPPAPPDGKAAGVAQIQSILDEINTIPPVRMSVPSGDATLRIANLPIFSAKDLEGYKADYHTKRELDEMIKINPDKYVLRQAVLDAAQALRDNAKFTMEESLTSSGGPISPALKKQFLQKQKEPGLAIFELERALGKLQDAGKERDKEPSKRWHAHYDYALARLMGRLVYTYEYNYILAEVRGDRLPELDPKIHNGWRVASRQRISINESKVKDMAKTIGRTWKRIAEEHAGTPWAIMAKRESLTALGLEWKPSRE